MLDYKILSNVPSVGDFRRAQEEFELKKKSVQADIARQAGGGQDPAALRLANEYLLAKKSGDMERANAIESFAKTQQKGIMQMQDGSYVPLAGMPQALGQLEFGKESGTQQAKDIYEPNRAGAIEGAKLEQQLGYEPEIKKATSLAQKRAESMSDLNERVSSMPQLELTVKKLNDLGKKATYTYTGRALNFLRKEAGMDPREEAVARKEYISLVDNQVLPLLRQTFGAQFTQKEGESLKQTLGDPNSSPEEKDAVLRSFIDQKYATIGTLQRQIDPMQEHLQAVQEQQTRTSVSPMQRDDMGRAGIITKLRNSGIPENRIDAYLRSRGM